MALEDLTRLARAVEENWCAAWASLGDLNVTPRTEVTNSAECLRICTPGQPEMLLNMVLRFASAAPVTSAAIERTIAPFRQHRLPFQWWLTLGTQPAGLREQLRALGMQTWGGATSMTLHLPGWRPNLRSLGSGIALGPVASAEDAAAALHVICEVFYVPPEPMALWTVRNAAFQVYCVYHVATLPSARRRGIAGNLLVLALADAAAAGATLATLTATPEARSLYERLGFRTCGKIEQWVPGPELSLALTGPFGYTAYQRSDL